MSAHETDKPTTFRDVVPQPKCPKCSQPPVRTSEEAPTIHTCSQGHTWQAGERTLKL